MANAFDASSNPFSNDLKSSHRSQRSKSISNSNKDSNLEETLKDPFLEDTPVIENNNLLPNGTTSYNDSVHLAGKLIGMPQSIEQLEAKFAHLVVEGYQEE